MPHQKFVHCGNVLKPHGLKGELCTLWFADSPLLLQGLSRIYLGLPGSRPKGFRIASWRKHQDTFLVFVDGINGRDQAEKWRGAQILVPGKDIPALPEDEVYVFELAGSRVFLENGLHLGVLEEVLDNNGSEIWRIMTMLGKEVLFPVHDRFILKMAPQDQRIVIDPPPGLLEIYGVDHSELDQQSDSHGGRPGAGGPEK